MDSNYNNYNNYNPYTNPQQAGENSMGGSNFEQQPVKKRGFGVKMLKVVVIALIFGLVAGATGLGILRFGGEALGLFQEANGNPGGNGDGGNNQKPGIGNNNDGEKNPSQEGNSQTPPVTDPIPDTDNDTDNLVIMMDVSELVEDAMPCIVAITNISETYVQGMWGPGRTEETESCGTGFLVQQDGQYVYIATNNHVVEGAKELTVQFCDGAEVQAEIKGQIPSRDLAVIKVALKDMPAETKQAVRIARLGDSNELKVGEGAIAIGNALGYGQSVTTGVVSALGRSVTVTDSVTGTTIVNNNLIQTDAAINPGNSGGALFNAKGEVIGINSVKYSDTSVEGIGYAIPISDAMLVINKLISGQQVDVAKSGYLGIQGVDSNYGVYVYKVFKDSAADKAGLAVGDIIVEFEGNTIATMSQLKELLSYYASGETVEFVVYKAQGNDYVAQKVTITLGDASTVQE